MGRMIFMAVTVAATLSIPTQLLGPGSRCAISFLEAVAATTSSACPARGFSEFVQAFAERVEIQRRYTRLPLLYGHLDVYSIGTTRENEAFSRRIIASFEAIPLVDPKDGGRLFPSKAKRTKNGFEVKIGPDDENPNVHTIATVFLPDTGFALVYRFIKSGTCWVLVGIDDRST
jgi:hypothetical protein